MLRFNTLGRLYVTRDGRRLAGAAAQPRRLALLAVLAAAGDRGVSRDRLVALLWPDTEEERARKGLNQALYALRQDLGSDEAIAGARDLRLDTSIVVCDVDRFRSAVARGELTQAIDEYAGPFLDGFHLAGAPEFERWAEQERAVLAREHASALERLARQADERGDHAAAVDWLRRLAGHDPLDARTAVRLMEALARAGDPTAALQHARVYELLVQQELDAPPDAQVVALAERIRREAANPRGRAPGPESGARVGGQSPEPESGARVATPAPEPDPTPAAPAPAPSPATHRTPWRRRAIAVGGGVVVLAALVASGARLRGRDAASVRLGSTHRLTVDPGLEVDAVPSPDGRVVAYAAGPEGAMRLYVRQVEGGRAVAVVPADAELNGDQRRPRWSPDGTRLLFQAERGIWQVPSLGGVSRPVIEPPGGDRRALYPAWSPDGKALAWVQGDTIYTRLLEGGAARRITVLKEAHSLAWSPDGRWIAAVGGNAEFLYGAVGMLPGQTSIGNAAPSAVYVVRAEGEGGEPVRVTEGEHLHTSPEWRAPGQLMFVSDQDGSRDVFVATIGDDGRVTGTPDRLTTGLAPLSIGVSADGRTLTYVSFAQRANVWALPIASAAAGIAAARPVTTGAQVVEGFDVSPDGKWLAFDAERSGHQEIFRLPLDCGDACPEPERIVEADESSFRPSWAPDGRTIVFYAFENGVRHAFATSAQGAPPARLLPSETLEVHSPVLSPDGTRLTFHRDLATGSQLFESVRGGDGGWGAPRQLTVRGGWGARRSPDGAALVYLAPNEVRVMGPSGERDARALWTAGGAAGLPQPVWLRWAPDGRALWVKAFDARGVGSIWALPYPQGAPRLLVRFDDPLRPTRRPELAADATRLYFTIAEREADLWLVRLRDR